MTGPLPPIWTPDDAEFVHALEDGSLPAASFDHRSHLRYAWLLLRRHPLAEVLPRVEAALLRFATLHHAPDKFHQTVTWTYVLVVHELLQSHPEGTARSFDSWLARHPFLLEPVPRFMARFYAPASWQSERARAHYVLPDPLRSGLAA